MMDPSSQVGIAERLASIGQTVQILVVAANPLEAQPLKLDAEVRDIQEALRRSRKRENFKVEMRLAATPRDLRRALLDIEPHVLHFAGHGAGKDGLLFVTDESAHELYRSEDGAVRAKSDRSGAVQYVSAERLANLLKRCVRHLECVILNACYSDVQADVISAHIPYTIGMRDAIGDRVARKFSEGFYDALGAGKTYEEAFDWGKVAIEFDIGDQESTLLPLLRRKGQKPPMQVDMYIAPSPIPHQQPHQQPHPFHRLFPDIAILRQVRYTFSSETLAKWETIVPHSLRNRYIGSKVVVGLTSTGIITVLSVVANQLINIYQPPGAVTPNPTISSQGDLTFEQYFDRALNKQMKGDKQGAIADYNEAIKLKPDYAAAYNNRGLAKSVLGDKNGAIADYNEAIKLKPDDALAYYNRGNAKSALGDKNDAISDYNEAIKIKSDYADAYNNRGNAKSALEDKIGAIEDYNEAIKIKPDYADAYYNRGLSKSVLEDKNDAIEDYNEAIKIKPDYADAYYNRGNAKSVLGGSISPLQ